MKDTHLIIALYRALDRYGSTKVPNEEHDANGRARKGPPHEDRRRTAGWVSVAEIEASQSPNTYPRLTRRAIRMRCEALAGESRSPVQGVRTAPGGLRTWVLVAPPGDAAPTEGERAREASPPAAVAEVDAEDDVDPGTEADTAATGPRTAFVPAF